MFNKFSKLFVTAGAAATIATGALVPRPAAADTQDTIDTILGAAALIGGIVLYNDYAQDQQADQVCGYTTNGGRVYGDGRIVMPDGQTFYPGQYNGGQYAYNRGWHRVSFAPAPQYRAPAPQYQGPVRQYRASAPQFRAPVPTQRFAPPTPQRNAPDRGAAPGRNGAQDRGGRSR